MLTAGKSWLWDGPGHLHGVYLGSRMELSSENSFLAGSLPLSARVTIKPRTVSVDYLFKSLMHALLK